MIRKCLYYGGMVVMLNSARDPAIMIYMLLIGSVMTASGYYLLKQQHKRDA